MGPSRTTGIRERGRRVTRALSATLGLLSRSPHRFFVVAFAAFVVWAYVMGWKYPLGPGQDQHYHLMSAWITSRWWLGDAHIRALYKFVDPLDANTFVYTFLFPFEAVLPPLDAWRVGWTTLYLVGYPLGCAFALHLLRRPLWGALLAFPLAYIKSWSQGGYMPFVSAGAFFVIAIAAMHRVLEDAPDATAAGAKSRRRVLVIAVLFPALTLVAHGHVYTWLMVVLGAATLVALGRELVVGIPASGARALVSATRLGLRALFVVLPSLCLFGIWYWRTHRGENAAHGAVSWAPQTSTWNNKVVTFAASFVHVKSDAEWGWVGATMCVVLLVMLLAGRPTKRELPTPELATVLSLASFFLLPPSVGGQSLGLRQVDFFVWLLPLVVLPARPEGRLRMMAAVSVILGYAVMRLDYVYENLALLQKELAGIQKLAKPCPEPHQEIAYATFGSYSNSWEAPSLQQAHETYAAICGLDAPVYDPTEYPHNLLPVRYRGKPPAPVTIIVDDSKWWQRPNLWKDFDLVMVRNWHPSGADLEDIQKVAVRLRLWNEWQLWHRKPDLSRIPP